MSLYTKPGTLPGSHVSFDRPYDTVHQGPTWWELSAVHFLERHGYDVSYTTDVDTDRDPASLLRHALVLTLGHDEYWTQTMRERLRAARDAGVNLGFLGANTGYWQIRYEDGRRTLVEYRHPDLDPEPDPALKTTTFRELTPPRPECTLLGVGYGQLGDSNDYTVNDSALGDSWFRDTGFTPGSTLHGLVGYEWDGLQPGCAVPSLTVFFHSEHQNGEPPVEGARWNADVVRYTAPSGARVFDAASFQFAWGLDPFQERYDARLDRFLRNGLDDLTRPAAPALGRQRSRGRPACASGSPLRTASTSRGSSRFDTAVDGRSRLVSPVSSGSRWPDAQRSPTGREPGSSATRWPTPAPGARHCRRSGRRPIGGPAPAATARRTTVSAGCRNDLARAVSSGQRVWARFRTAGRLRGRAVEPRRVPPAEPLTACRRRRFSDAAGVKTILFVGAGRHQRRAILQARERGLRVVAVDRNPDAPGLAVADVPETVDFMDVDAVTEVAERHGVDGALTVSADRAVPVVAAVTERLGLPSIGTATAHLMTHKVGMRRTLAEAGVPQPRFAAVRDLREPLGGRDGRGAVRAQAGRFGRPARRLPARVAGRPRRAPARRARRVEIGRRDRRVVRRRHRDELHRHRPRRRGDRS